MEKRSISLAGHRTSVRLEPAFWRALEHEASLAGISLPHLIGRIDQGRLVTPDAAIDDRGTGVEGAGMSNLASALRVFVLETLQHRIDGDPKNKDRPD